MILKPEFNLLAPLCLILCPVFARSWSLRRLYGPPDALDSFRRVRPRAQSPGNAHFRGGALATSTAPGIGIAPQRLREVSRWVAEQGDG
jgi:hypothetical protein